MGILLQNRRSFLILSLLVGILLLFAACSADPSVQLISPEMDFSVGEQLVEAKPTPTPEILDITSLTTDEIFAGLPADIAAAIQGGDAAAGEQIAQLNGCIGCHSLEKGGVLVGPSWYGVANQSIKRVPGESPAFYLYHSVANPGDFVVDGYPAGVMPATYADSLSTEDMGNLIAYLLTFTGQ